MIKNFEKKQPELAAVLYMLLAMIFPVISGFLSGVFSLKELPMFWNMAIFFAIAIAVGVWIIKNRGFSKEELGIRAPALTELKNLLWFAPLILIEVPMIINGLREDIRFSLVLALLVFTISVAIAEELYFRGIILSILRRKGTSFGIMLSAILFGVAHLGNLLGGKSLSITGSQVFFALLFGLVAAEIVVRTKSLLFPVIWHIAHNFLSYAGAPWTPSGETRLLIYQCAVLVVYSLYLWKNRVQTSKSIS